MKMVKSVAEMQVLAKQWQREGLTVGFVPTMGFLHAGHASLMKLLRDRCDRLVVSIFVNPIQFGPNEDLDAYPRDIDRDEQTCLSEQVDAIFYPEVAEMYHHNATVSLQENALSQDLCGLSRPGHFNGVLTVVAKFFNIVHPDCAAFGQKDAQQLRLIQRMVRDLNFPIQIVPGPIVRESDGLAMSSRNKYLTPAERQDALCLRRSLDLAENLIASGEISASVIEPKIRSLLNSVNSAQIDYIKIVDWENLSEISTIVKPTLLALAVRIGPTRLIDNCILQPPS